MPSRRLLLMCSAIATVLLGLVKVGVVEVVPGADLRFTWAALRAPESPPTLVLRSDVGEFVCWVHLVVAGNTSTPGTSVATLAGCRTVLNA